MITFDSLRLRLNTVLIRTADLKVEGKTPEQISIGEIFGYMDAGGYLILLLSLLASVLGGFLFGMGVVMIWPEKSFLADLVPEFPVVCAIPGVLIGFATWYLLFRVKRWLAGRSEFQLVDACDNVEVEKWPKGQTQT
jgi:hypothetical protein